MVELGNRLDWPALGEVKSRELRWRRGVWGKAHRASSDFRWLARTEDFARSWPDLGRQLNLGLEDQSASLPCWRASKRRYGAVAVYPSRAEDASGRRGFLEKQILEWRPDASEPAALGALALLPAAARLNDAIWWSRQSEAGWDDPDFVLGIPSGDRALRLTTSELAECIAVGRRELRETTTETALVDLYSDLLAGHRPALLRGPEAPLTPLALAVLLLPLPRNLADRLSLAGWIPASRADLQTLAERWDVMVVPPSLRVAGQVRPRDPGSLAEAHQLARALLLGKPEDLARSEDVEIADQDEVVPEAPNACPRPVEEEEAPGGSDPVEDPWKVWTQKMRHDLEGTTIELIEQGSWATWRQWARLQPRERLNTAMAWLGSDIWSRDDAPAASKKVWEEVLDDVGTLTGARLKRLTGPGGRHTWPWVAGHEKEQLRDLSQMVRGEEDRRLLLRSVAGESCVADLVASFGDEQGDESLSSEAMTTEPRRADPPRADNSDPPWQSSVTRSRWGEPWRWFLLGLALVSLLALIGFRL